MVRDQELSEVGYRGWRGTRAIPPSETLAAQASGGGHFPQGEDTSHPRPHERDLLQGPAQPVNRTRLPNMPLTIGT
jgi:hypothetical protein